MKCPVCSVELKMSERQGVEIDYCPQCRGVWLDRGELDKIIEKTNHETVQREQHNVPTYKVGDKRYKRKSMLGEIFDFD